jgi:hypothetical protein
MDSGYFFPPKGLLYRGGGLPDEHKSFYQVGQVFRASSFLSTSFDRSIADQFMVYADTRREPCVLWEIRLHPGGEYSALLRCKHVNLVAYSNLERELEYLFAPYSPFTVKEVSIPRGRMQIKSLDVCNSCSFFLL